MKKIMILLTVVMISVSGMAFGYDVYLKNGSKIPLRIKDVSAKQDECTKNSDCWPFCSPETCKAGPCYRTTEWIDAGKMNTVFGRSDIKDNQRVRITYAYTPLGSTQEVTKDLIWPFGAGGVCLYFDGTDITGNYWIPGGGDSSVLANTCRNKTSP